MDRPVRRQRPVGRRSRQRSNAIRYCSRSRRPAWAWGTRWCPRWGAIMVLQLLGSPALAGLESLAVASVGLLLVPFTLLLGLHEPSPGTYGMPAAHSLGHEEMTHGHKIP